jgi:hypothetical protein
MRPAFDFFLGFIGGVGGAAAGAATVGVPNKSLIASSLLSSLGVGAAGAGVLGVLGGGEGGALTSVGEDTTGASGSGSGGKLTEGEGGGVGVGLVAGASDVEGPVLVAASSIAFCAASKISSGTLLVIEYSVCRYRVWQSK